MGSPSKKFILSILRDKRYIILFIIFCGLFVFGKKVGLPIELEQPFYRPAFLEREGGIIINNIQEGFIAQNAISTIPGQSYRIIFSYVLNKDVIETEISEDNIKAKRNLDIIVLSKGGKEKRIDNLEILKMNSWQTHEVIFTADDYYSSIFFKKDLPIKSNNIQISNIEIDTLDFQNLNLSNKGIFGDVYIVNGQEISNMNNRDILIGFNKKPMSFIQTFMAENEYFYGIDIAMKFFGNGGEGNYKLEIVALDDHNQVQETLNSVQFNTSAEQTNQISPSVYRFVLPAKLIKDQKYGIRISNPDVIISFIHHLQIYGEKTNEEKDGAYLINKNDIKKPIGQSAIMPLYLKRTINENERLLLDSRIRDVSEKKIFYSYNFANRNENILDIYESNTIVTLDKEQKAFIAKYKEGTEYFTIKTWTKYPIQEINIQANQIEGSNIIYAIFEYSFNGKDWNKIEPYGTLYSNSFNYSLAPDLISNVLYLRVSPEKQNIKYLGKQFGLSGLTINAILERR